MTAPVARPPRRAVLTRTVRQVLLQSGAASITTQDPTDYVPPGTLPVRPPPAPVGGRRRPANPFALGRGPVAHGSLNWRVRPRRRLGPRRPMAVVLVLVGIVLAIVGYQQVTGTSLLAGLYPEPGEPPRRFPMLAASEPTRIAARSIDLDAPLTSVGLAPDGTIAAPPDDQPQVAGWYDQSPTPGQYGPSVLVGHVDTRTGPAVFHQLGRLRTGDRVEIGRVDGTVAIFQVTSTKRYDKERFPADQVFGDFDRPGLRLITCGGRWVGGQVGYADNVVVYATLVAAR
ncbi:class F sortase [Plantactinospora sp. GCM10030261]|uniref:class F sortase n=1 Tax=Plantactinospora sp. GCM10030261 TaxID=3273420 RepID=UPI003616F6DF